MTQPQIPKLKSRYIPVFTANYALRSNVHWWKPYSPFYYPNVLLNLDTVNPQQLEEIELEKNNVFLLTDSGGFQNITGRTNLTWMTSLQKQLDLKATKLFCFDKPPVKRSTQGGSEPFKSLPLKEYKERVEENLDVALLQSNWLKQRYPDRIKDLCYVLHADSKEMLDYNLELIEKKIGINKYHEYFGGVCYAIKKSDYILLATFAAHSKEHFINKGIYVHFLGIGSSNRMMILIKFEIDTFDSSNIMQGSISWSIKNPTSMDLISLTKDSYPFTKQFCTCPVCQDVNYNKLIEDDNSTLAGKWFVAHNLWEMLKLNVLLDSINKSKYTDFVRQNFKLNKKMERALEYIDVIDKEGFEKAYNRYRNYIKDVNIGQSTLA